MTKFFKNLCLILAILIIPAFFVACGKDPSDPVSEGGSGGGGGTVTPPAEVVFELNETAANEIISSSVTKFETAISSLNGSEILNIENAKANEVKSTGLFGYLYYANEFKKALGTTPVKLDGVYAYRLGGLTNSNYFHVYNEGNNKLFANYLVVEANSYQYIGYEIILDNGNITQTNINYFETNEGSGFTLFYNGKLNFETSTFEVFSGQFFEHTRTYLETNLNDENVDNISWNYTYYDKYVFDGTKAYEHNYNNETSRETIETNIESFNVLKVFDVYDEYTALGEGEIYRILTNDTNYIQNIKDNNGGVSYVYRDNKIEKSI